MSEQNNLVKRKQKESDPMNEKVSPTLLTMTAIYLVVTLGVMIFGATNPNNWFSQRFLHGYWNLLVALVILVVMMVFMGVAEVVIAQRKKARERNSPPQ